MTAYDPHFFDIDELDEFDEFGDFEDDYDELDDFDWARALNTAASIGESVYGNYGSSWGKKNKLWDSAIRGALGAVKGASKTWFQDGIDGDPFEPEYDTEDIDAMEEIAEDALDGDYEERAMAADELVARSFGPARRSPALRPVLMALRRQVQRILIAARRNPRLRVVARLAPLALRRTSVIVTRMAMARRPVSVTMAMRIFRGLLSRMMKSHAMRGRAIAMARRRAARARSGYRPRRTPSYGGHGPRLPRHVRFSGRAAMSYPMEY